MPNRRAHDHLTDHNWQLEIEGVTQGAFAEVSGLDSETEVIEYQDGNDLILRKRPAAVPRSNTAGPIRITLKHGYINNTELWSWSKAVMDGKIERKSGSVILAGDEGGEIMRYNFTRAYPKAWVGMPASAGPKVTPAQEIVLECEQVKVIRRR